MKWGLDQQSDRWLRTCRIWLLPVAFVIGLVFVASGIGIVADGKSVRPLATGIFIVIVCVLQWVRVGAEIARREEDGRRSEHR